MKIDRRGKGWVKTMEKKVSIEHITERVATQRFAVRLVLTKHTMEILDGDLIETIVDELENEMVDGSCAWAFKEGEKHNETNEI